MPSSNDIEKLKILLPHWIEHNQEHAQEFRTWAEGAETSQQDFYPLLITSRKPLTRLALRSISWVTARHSKENVTKKRLQIRLATPRL
jgi:hypothetical protein